jgi:hypothetical protein
MDVHDVVLRKEDDGKRYYGSCGLQAVGAELKRLFEMLSQDEARHAEALRALHNGVRVELSHSPTLDGAKHILRTLSLRQQLLAEAGGELDGCLAAMAFEAATASLCCELAREAVHGWQRELYLKIAAEDEIHFTVIEHLRELLATALQGDEHCQEEVCDG